MQIRFESFSCAHFNNIGEIINKWLDRHLDVEVINWRQSGGDDRINVVIEYYRKEECNDVPI